MNLPNFGQLLDKPSEEIERPKPLPVGTYICVVDGLPKYDKSSKKQTEFVEFTLRPLEAAEDVDKDALEEIGGIADRTIRATFYLTEDAMWRLKKFLIEDLLIDVPPRQGLREAIDMAPGQQCLAVIRHQAGQDGQSVYAQLSSTSPIVS